MANPFSPIEPSCFLSLLIQPKRKKGFLHTENCAIFFIAQQLMAFCVQALGIGDMLYHFFKNDKAKRF
ncbi:MAG: hypothetical protein JXR70_18295 [Spirochaetales bacterium]|nr:hypothetical protein [Spirochaetales bacterium]